MILIFQNMRRSLSPTLLLIALLFTALPLFLLRLPSVEGTPALLGSLLLPLALAGISSWITSFCCPQETPLPPQKPERRETPLLEAERERLTQLLKREEEKREEEGHRLLAREAQCEGLEREIERNKRLLEQRDRRINELEGQVRTLTYEIRTLLQIEKSEKWTEGPLPLEVKSDYDALILLQHCIDQAQRLLPLQGAVGSPIDYRYLFETVNRQERAAILIYDPGEEKVLFANKASERFSGYSPIHLCRKFEQLIEGTHENWKSAVEKLAPHQETIASIRFTGRERLTLSCCLGFIPSGPYQGLVIGVLFPQAKQVHNKVC